MLDTPALVAEFQSAFGEPPDAVWSAPGRVNLLGEHTDYNGGLVLPFAIGARTAVGVRARDDDRLRARSRQHPDDPYDGRLSGPSPAGWAGYAAGVLRVLHGRGAGVRGVDLLVDSDLPEGAGLSSSAALEVAVAAAVSDVFRLGLAREQVAEAARAAETEIVGVPCGPMDQIASVFGEAGHVILLDCATGHRDVVPFEPAAEGCQVLIVDTGVRHALAGGEYAARRHACERAAKELGVENLSTIGEPDLPAALGRLADPTLQGACRHVVSENARVRSAVAALRARRIASIGPLLTASHRSLRDDFRVSCPELDVVVAAVIAAGALGARLTGAGFGGSVVALLPDGRLDDVPAQLTRACRRSGQPQPVVSVVAPSQGVRRERG